MSIRTYFGIFALLQLTTFGLLAYFLFKSHSLWFFILEAFIFCMLIFFVYFYKKLIQPMRVLSSGIELLNEQDVTSRLHHVGNLEADNIVDVFNRLNDQLKNEKLHVREQHHLLDLLITASPMGVIILTLDGHLQLMNPSACHILGLDAPPKRLEELSHPILTQLSSLEQNASITVRLSNSYIYKCTHSIFFDHGFKHSFYLLEPLSEEVRKAEKNAYEKVIRMIAHEVNNTTAGIIATFSVLEEALNDEAVAEEDYQDILSLVRSSSERCNTMSRFISRIADVIRIPIPQFKNESINERITSSQRFIESMVYPKHIAVSFDLAESLPLVQLDAVLFERVLINIITNSIESIGENGCIRIHTFVEHEPFHPKVILEIADNGTGIDPDVAQRLFTPFYSTKPNGQGIGLLFIREVLLLHEARFTLTTDSDLWTRFRIIFSS